MKHKKPRPLCRIDKVVRTTINISSHFNNYNITLSPGIIRQGRSFNPLSLPEAIMPGDHCCACIFPALTTASAFPFLSSSKAILMEDVFLFSVSLYRRLAHITVSLQ
jgi:hypothetical protein